MLFPISMKRCMDTQMVVHPHSEVLLSNKKEGTIPWLVKSMGSEELRTGMADYELYLD